MCARPSPAPICPAHDDEGDAGAALLWPTDPVTLLPRVEAAMRTLLAPQVAHSVLPPMAAALLTGGGKRMRARLALQAACALGADVRAACAWAAACELMHNATLVHDDLQDGDTTRRGKPTLWVAHGQAQAINAGDWLLMLAFCALEAMPRAASRRCGFALCQALAKGMAQVIEGQGLECASSLYFGNVAAFPYEAMVRGKTAALFCLPVLGAALLANFSLTEAHALAAPFAELGVLFQMQDDVLDLWGDKGRGLRGADLYEGKLSALVVAHLAQHPGDAAWLEALLRAPRQRTEAHEVARAIDLFERRGTRARVLAAMERRSARVQEAADPLLKTAMAALLAQTWAPLAPLRSLPTGRDDGRPRKAPCRHHDSIDEG